MATGFLFTNLTGKIKRLSEIVNDHLLKTLYIHVSVRQSYPNFKTNQWACKKITDLYSSTAQMFPNLDVRIILHELKSKEWRTKPMKEYNIDVVIASRSFDKEQISIYTKGNKNLPIILLDDLDDLEEEKANGINSPELKMYDNVVLGGTFDRLHAGHKILLSEALLRCKRKVTVGITDTNMLQNKILWELIEPCNKRIDIVKSFIEEVDMSLTCDVVPITDMYGPTKSDPTFNMIVVSTETKRGGDKINELRSKNGLNELDIQCIDIVSDNNNTEEEESKISSSNKRMRLLGTRIKEPVPNRNIPAEPYVIGLTGGIASGKSSIGKYLEKLGAGLIDCDKIAHQLYKKDTDIYKTLIKEFGNEIIAQDGEIDRKALGKIVFNNQEKLRLLNNLLWPSILEEALSQAQQMHVQHRKKVVVLEAAVLLRAGWHDSVHEVWTAIVPPSEAIKRLMDRNGLSETDARSRLESQPSNLEQVAISNVIFSTLWSYEYTRKQVDKAWNLLQTGVVAS